MYVISVLLPSQDLAALAAPFRARARGGWHSSYLTRQIFRVF